MDSPQTPAPSGRFKSMFRSILRDRNTPSTGQNVRWDARDAFRTITPNTSGNSTDGVPTTPLLEDEEHTSFLDRLQNDSNDEGSGAGRIDQLAALGQSVGLRLTSSHAPLSTTPPSSGPALAPRQPAPIPRPRFQPSAPPTSSPLALNRDDSSLSFPNMHSMSPAPDYSLSHKPFDMSREMEAIPAVDENSGLASDASVCGVKDGSRGGQPSVITLGEVEESGEERDGTQFFSAGAADSLNGAPDAASHVDNLGKSVRGMTTLYPPGMYNFTKTQQRIPSFSVEADSSVERSRTSVRPKLRDTTGSSSLEFITRSSPSPSASKGPRTSLPAQSVASPSGLVVSRAASVSLSHTSLLQTAGSPRASLPLRSKPFSTSLSHSNILSHETTTAPPRELPTFYPPGYLKFEQTKTVVDPENIPELTRFFTPSVGTETRDISRTGLEHQSQEESRFDFDPRSRDSGVLSPTGIPLPSSPSPPLSSSTLSSVSSLPTPTSLDDLSLLIESQYKADLAAHAALVPLLIARAESAETSAKRLAGVVKSTKNRVRDLELLCGELGHEVGVLREERTELVDERADLVEERDSLAHARETLLSEVGNLSTDLTMMAQARTGLDAGSGPALREMQSVVRRAEAEASRSRRRKEERDAARGAVAELEGHIEDMKREWETRERDWDVRLERERDGQGARETFGDERKGWERERVELVDRCVRAEKALEEERAGGVPELGPAGDQQRLRKELEEYKREVEAQWKYAEQADEQIKALQAEVNSLRSQTRPKSSSAEAEWERQRQEWAQQQDSWTRTQAAWIAERARIESKHGEMRAEVSGLRDQLDNVRAERDELHARAGDMEKMEAELEKMDGEMAALADRARHAEEMYLQAQKEVEAADKRVKELERRLDNGRMEGRKEMMDGVRAAEDRLRDMEQRAEELEERCVRAENERSDVMKDRGEIEQELQRLRVEMEDVIHVKGEAEQDRDALAEELVSEQEANAALAAEHQKLVLDLQQAEREHQFALENQQRLERVIEARNEELAQTEERVLVHAREAEQLRADKRELERVKIQRDDTVQAEEHLRKQLEEAVKTRAAEGAELNAAKDRVKQLGEETARLQKRVNVLMAESADKEVRIVQLNKARAMDADDKDGLNVALESKQQELELIKRKLGVRGTAGATPAPSRVQRTMRRESSTAASSMAYETPLPRALRKDLNDIPPPSESTASVLSSSINTNPLQTSSRINIYDAVTSTPATVKPARRTSEYVPRPSIRTSASFMRTPSISVSGRGVHFAPSESGDGTETGSDATL